LSYTIIFKPAAAREFRKLPQDVQRRLRPKIDALASDPRPPGSEKLSGSEDAYRIRAGDYRVLYRIEDNVLLVSVVRVAYRREAYR
jgi:mRNA interferase RelE/StbE